MGNRNSNERNQEDEINRLPVEILEKVFATLLTLEDTIRNGEPSFVRPLKNCSDISTKWSQIIANMLIKGINSHK